MQTHAIIEVEDGAMQLVVGRKQGDRVVVTRALRMPLPDLRQETIANALRGIGSDMLEGAAGIHVIVGERRAQHFLSTVPKMSPTDAVAFVTREALRLGNGTAAEELLVTTRLVRRLQGRKMLLATATMPRTVWKPIRIAFESAGLKVLSLRTTESCLAMAAGETTDPTAVLECNGNRARFVLSIDRAPVQGRRFLIGGGADLNPGAIMAQLAMELPRTFDWLRETGQPQPKVLAVGLRIPLDDESLAMLAADDTQLVRAASPVDFDRDDTPPSIGAATLLARLVDGAVPGSLLDPPSLKLPVGAGVVVTALAASAVGILGGYSAVVDGRQWLDVDRQRDTIVRQCDELEAQLDGGLPDELQDLAVADPHLQEAMKMRRPISRLLAEISNSGADGVHVNEVRFASRSPVVVSGQIDGDGRQDALTRMAAFTRKVEALPYLEADNEEVAETPASPGRLRFKISLRWRTR